MIYVTIWNILEWQKPTNTFFFFILLKIITESIKSLLTLTDVGDDVPRYVVTSWMMMSPRNKLLLFKGILQNLPHYQKKGIQAVTGAVPFQKVNVFNPFFTHKGTY